MTAADGRVLPLVLVEENHDLPLVRLTLSLRRGAAEDPPGQYGLAQFAAELSRRGAGELSREALDARLESLGADLAVSVNHDAVTYDVQVLRRHLDAVLAILADVLLRPACDAIEAAQLVRETHAMLDELEEDDPQNARRFFARALFRDRHPYGHPVLGTRSSIEQLDHSLARRWLSESMGRDSLVVGLAGDIDTTAAADLVARHFGALGASRHERVHLPLAASVPGVRVQLVDKPERTQAQILLGHPVVAWSEPAFTPLSVAVNGFGGTFTGRLMTEVRVKRGLSYGAMARLGQGRGPRSVWAYVFPASERTGETLTLMLDLWRDWISRGMSDDEIAFARENLASAFTCDLVTPEDRLDLRLAMALYGLPDDYLTATPSRIRQVSADAVRQVMREHLKATDLTVTVLGTATELIEQIEAIPHTGAISVVPYDRFE